MLQACGMGSSPPPPPPGLEPLKKIRLEMTLCTGYLDQAAKKNGFMSEVPLYSERPMSSEYDTYKRVKARFWPWLLGKSP